MLIHEIVEFAARRDPAETAIVFEDVALDFGDLDDRARRMATVLAARTGPGDRIAVLSHNTTDYVTLFAAASLAGVVLVLLNQRLHPTEWADQLERTDTCLVLGQTDLLEQIGGTSTLSWADLAEATDVAETLVAPRPSDERDPAWIIFTSGTTGRPKGAVLTHRSLLAGVMNASIGRPVRPDDIYVFPFPLCHVAAYNVLIQHLHARPVVLLERFDPAAVVDAIDRHRATTISLAPTMIAALLDDPSFDARRLGTLRSIGYGASAIPVEVLRRGLDRLDCDFAQGYGMTELSGNAVFLDARLHRRAAVGEEHLLASAGRPGPLAAVRLADDGEIEVRGDQVMAGYWNDPETTSAAFTDDGWFRTGDIGRIDDEGLLSIIDRKKDLVVTGGENVSSREVEDVLQAHPSVAEVAVIGTPEARWGEAITAVVVVRAGHHTTAADLIDHCRSRLASYKKPRRIEFVESLPVNASGKIQKRELREQFG